MRFDKGEILATGEDVYLGRSGPIRVSWPQEPATEIPVSVEQASSIIEGAIMGISKYRCSTAEEIINNPELEKTALLILGGACALREASDLYQMSSWQNNH